MALPDLQKNQMLPGRLANLVVPRGDKNNNGCTMNETKTHYIFYKE